MLIVVAGLHRTEMMISVSERLNRAETIISVSERLNLHHHFFDINCVETIFRVKTKISIGGNNY